MKTILIDMDAIVADLASEWYKRYNEATGKNITTADVNQWDVGKAIGDKSIYKYLTQPGLYWKLPPIQPAIDTLKRLHKLRVGGEKVYELFVLTAAIAHPQIIPDKMAWLEEHMPFIDRKHQVFAYHKHLVFGDYFIDDSPKNLTQWKARFPTSKTVTVTYPYNRDVMVDIRGNDYTNPEGAWKYIEDSLAIDRGNDSVLR
jgi:5'-nucleotidase